MKISRKQTKQFVSLHSHTTNSYGDGFGTVPQHVRRIQELGGEALALSEHGNANSWVQLEKATKGTGVKPIYGMEAYAAPSQTRQKFHQTILAENLEGLRNLNQIVSRSYKEGFYQWPTVHGDMLLDHSEGLILTSGCADSLLSCTLLGGKSLGEKRERASRFDMDNAETVVRRFQDIFGDGYYLEVQRFPGLERACTLNPAFAELSRRTGVPLVATADVHYPYGSQNEMQKILHASHRGGTVASVEAGWEYDILLTYPKSDREIFDDLVETGLSRRDAWGAIQASNEIASRCNVTLPRSEPLRFPIPGGESAQELVWEWLREGWSYRFPDNRNLRRNQDEYVKRLNYEMSLITEKDFCDYFLMVSHAVRWAKDEASPAIPVGPARGSAAASLVCYLLRITEVDPMQFPTMLFERFIDHGRADLPDIDLDFADDRRDEVRQFLVRTYGADRVANIANVVHYVGKNSLNDVARVHHIPKNDTELVKSVIIERSGGDSRADSTLIDSIKMFPAALEAYKRNPKMQYAVELEGNIRGMSVHAAGIVVSNSAINETCAMMTRISNGEERTVLPYDKKDAEYLGMLKMDFLGLSTMGMIGIVLDMVGMSLADLYRVPLTNKKVLRAFAENDLAGIFQFEGRATRLVNAGVHPDHFMHLADINALSRPGPLFSGMTDDYMLVKNGKKKVDKIHPMVWKYTQNTYGQIIYQEQVLSIIRDIGGFPVAKIGDIRRIISQKLGEASMQTMFEDFVTGAKGHDIDRPLATRIWKFMVTSATYSFNIAHCISYSMLAFWCMYLKLKYPREFYSAQLRKIGEDKKAREYKRPRLLNDAVKHGIVVGRPDVEASQYSWAPHPTERDVIQPGFLQIPKVGPKAADAIVQYRDDNPAVPGGMQWDDLSVIKGIGPTTIRAIEDFAEKDDPFDIELTSKTLDEIREGMRRGWAGLRGLPKPTHRSNGIPARIEKDEYYPVTWMGIVRDVEYKDLIEDQRARTGDTPDEILARTKRPELLKWATLHCYDDEEEDVYVRFSRFDWPKYEDLVNDIVPGVDVIIVTGQKGPGFGVSVVKLKDLKVIEMSDDDEEDEVD